MSKIVFENIRPTGAVVGTPSVASMLFVLDQLQPIEEIACQGCARSLLRPRLSVRIYCDRCQE